MEAVLVSAALLPRARWRYLDGQPEVNSRIVAEARVRDAYREYAA